MHSPMSRFLRAQQCFVRHLHQCIRQGSALPCILLFCSCACASVCVSLALLSLCSRWSCCPYAGGSLVYYISVTVALLPFCVGAHGWVARICEPWERFHLGAGCQFTIFQLSITHSVCPPKFCINYCCEILLRGLHVPKSILQQ